MGSVLHVSCYIRLNKIKARIFIVLLCQVLLEGKCTFCDIVLLCIIFHLPCTMKDFYWCVNLFSYSARAFQPRIWLKTCSCCELGKFQLADVHAIYHPHQRRLHQNLQEMELMFENKCQYLMQQLTVSIFDSFTEISFLICLIRNVLLYPLVAQ